jgi:hypothetical protein
MAQRVRIEAEAFSAAASRLGLRWAPVFRDEMQNPEAGDYINRRIQCAFPLDDPRDTPTAAGSWSPDERAAFDRYIDHARDLAGSTLLTAGDHISVYQADQYSQPEITERFSPKDVTVGFMTMFRQFFATDEDASFKRVHGAVMREVKGSEPHKQVLRGWGKAQGQMRMYALEHLVLKALAEAGHIPKQAADYGFNPAHPDQRKAPQELLSIHWYGDMIHWGDKRDLLLRSDHDRFWAANERVEALQAAVELAHLYINFSAVVAAVTTGTRLP